MNLEEKLARIEKSQRMLLEEILQAKQEARILTEENQRLIRELSQVGNGDYYQMTANAAKIRQTAHENLERLYLERFHICHYFFGEERDGECLFCQGFFTK